MTIRDLINAWVAYSHRAHLKNVFGLDVADVGQARRMVEDVVAAGASMDRAGALARFRARGIDSVPSPDRPEADDLPRLSAVYHRRSTKLVLYSYGVAAGRRWRGLTGRNQVSDPLAPPSHSEFMIASDMSARALISELLARYSLSLAVVEPMPVAEAINLYVGWNARTTARLNGPPEQNEAEKLGAVCRKVGCQRYAAAMLFDAYGFPDPTPHVDGGPAQPPLQAWNVVRLRNALHGTPAGTPVVLMAKTPESPDYWRVADTTLRVLNYKVVVGDASFAYSPPAEVREFATSLFKNLATLFAAPVAATEAAPPSPVAAAAA